MTVVAFPSPSLTSIGQVMAGSVRTLEPLDQVVRYQHQCEVLHRVMKDLLSRRIVVCVLFVLL